MKKLILCGPSCSGKTTVKQSLVDEGLRPGVSYTTRKIRDGEREGIDYRFVSNEDFLRLIDDGYFVEYDDSFGDHYGTSREDFENFDVFILTPKAIRSLKDSGLLNDCLVVQLTAPLDKRIRRASERGDGVSKILNRIGRDNREFHGFSDYDVSIETGSIDVNDIIQRIKES